MPRPPGDRVQGVLLICWCYRLLGFLIFYIGSIELENFYFFFILITPVKLRYHHTIDKNIKYRSVLTSVGLSALGRLVLSGRQQLLRFCVCQLLFQWSMATDCEKRLLKQFLDGIETNELCKIVRSIYHGGGISANTRQGKAITFINYINIFCNIETGTLAIAKALSIMKQIN